MKYILQHITWLAQGIKVFALVGKSGTGKSFRAKLVAQKYNIDIIIDDGLIIHNEKILCGKSAKKEKNYLAAVKTAIFDDSQHRRESVHCLKKQKFKKVLILGTSDRMVQRIARRLDLPQINKYIHIEEIASEEDIQTAINSRNTGKHVIPVPAVEVERRYSSILYDSVKVFFKKNFIPTKGKRGFEKSVVRPSYGKKGRVMISEAALTQMVLHCSAEFEQAINIKKVNVKFDSNGYIITLHIHIPFGVQMSGNLHELQKYVIESIEQFTGIFIEQVNVVIEDISK